MIHSAKAERLQRRSGWRSCWLQRWMKFGATPESGSQKWGSCWIWRSKCQTLTGQIFCEENPWRFKAAAERKSLFIVLHIYEMRFDLQFKSQRRVFSWGRRGFCWENAAPRSCLHLLSLFQSFTLNSCTFVKCIHWWVSLKHQYVKVFHI